MNIHITNKKEFQKLFNSTIFKIEIGSSMYGLTNDKSDKDLLCIYATSDNELNSFHMSHHQLQYKENNIDYIFVNIHAFLRNCLSGDSTINLEVICSDKLKGTILEELYDMRFSFYNYKILRSYLGLAKRDIKRIDIDGNDTHTKNKKITHAYRGLCFAKKIIKNEELILSENELNFIKQSIWNIDNFSDRKEYANIILTEVESLRLIINSELNMVNYMSVENQKKLDSFLNNLMFSDFYNKKKIHNFDMSLFYDANENGVNY